VWECVEFGETPEEASALAAATFPALLRHIEVRSGEPIVASRMQEIIVNPQNEGCQTFEAMALSFDPGQIRIVQSG
jgi:hypothetical protein